MKQAGAGGGGNEHARGWKNGDREAGQSILLFDLFLITSFQGKQNKTHFA